MSTHKYEIVYLYGMNMTQNNIPKEITEFMKYRVRTLDLKNITPDLYSYVDGKINVMGEAYVVISPKYSDLESLPFKFGHVTGDFGLVLDNAKEGHITSFKNFPDYIGGDLLAHNQLINSLEGITPVVIGNVYVYDTLISSFHNIHHHLKHVEGYISSNCIESHVLGVFYIEPNKLRLISPLANISSDSPWKKVVQIVNTHLQNGDIHTCQEALLEAGLEEYAQV